MVVHTSDETEAAELLRAPSVDVVFVDSGVVGDAGSSVVGASLKNTRPRVPMMLIQNGSQVPPHLEEHVDVVTDESTFRRWGVG